MHKFYTVLAAVLLTAISFAQAPEKMSYQALVRDSGDNLVASQAVGMQISILQTTDTGTSVYTETQTPTTNVNGLVSIEIGTGTTTDDFSAIDWSVGPYFIKTETDPTGGTGYTITGTSQLLSVPYALHAKTVTKPTYTVNTFYAELGGYIIEVNTDGTHGLVVAMQDQGSSWWYTAKNLLNNAANHDANGAKFKDWRMPTKRELNLMYQVYVADNGANLNGSYYWSSTEQRHDRAWFQVLNFGVQDHDIKYAIYSVRAVRAF